MTRLTLLLPALLVLALLAAPAAQAADYRSCRGADPANGITAVRVAGTSCSEGLAVAKRTNSVKCFLNGSRCTHSFRGRRWTCTMSASRVHCRAGSRNVRYRLG